jgi:aromatic-L-amino-acid decarboxylase
MASPKAPVLPDQYRIKTGAPGASPGVSIDEQVAAIFSRATESPVMQTTAAAGLQDRLAPALPHGGTALESIVAELQQTAAVNYRKNAHPGCWAYISSPGLPTDPLAHAMTAALNQNVTGYHSAPVATVIEQTVISWMVQLTGLPQGSAGLVMSGGSLANLAALATARDRALGSACAHRGLHGAGPRPLLLAAETAHFSIARAAQLLGIGRQGIETIAVDAAHCMRVDQLEERLAALSQDDEQRVFCVVATAGTTATGAVDPLPAIAELCRRYGVWLHVDAAYGGAALLSEEVRERLRGIELADSITIDLHKWCYLSLDGSVLLYRDPEAAREVFHIQADYVRDDHAEVAEAYTFFDMSPEVSRRARALSVWLAFRHYGLEKLGRNVLHNVECAAYLARLVEASPDLELINEPQLSICCFRYAPAELAGRQVLLDDLNDRIVGRLAEQGDFLLSPTQVDGMSVLRVCIRSYTTRAGHVENFINDVQAIGCGLLDGKTGL